MGTTVSVPTFLARACTGRVPLLLPLSLSILRPSYIGDTTELSPLPDIVSIRSFFQDFYEISIEGQGVIKFIIQVRRGIGFKVILQQGIDSNFYEISPYTAASFGVPVDICGQPGTDVSEPPIFITVRIVRDIPGFAAAGTNYNIQLYTFTPPTPTSPLGFLVRVTITRPKSASVSS